MTMFDSIDDIDRDLFKKEFYQRAADYIKNEEGTIIFSAPYREEGIARFLLCS